MRRSSKRSFGSIEKLPSGRWRARYTGPDTATHKAPVTFVARVDAEAWLVDERRLVSSGEWRPPARRALLDRDADGPSLTEYAAVWMEQRDLKHTTRQHYRSLLERHILPSLGDRPVSDLTGDEVRAWHARLDRSRPTQRAHAYGLLKAICETAISDDLIVVNPCRIRGAGGSPRAKKVEPATLAELEAISARLPARYRPMMLLSAWCALRFGEVTELRRRDVDLATGVVRVRRGVTRTAGGHIVGDPKSQAGIRDVAIPPHLIPVLEQHLRTLPGTGRDALLFPAADGVSHMQPSSLYRVFYPARAAAGRPDLRWHDLRHTGAVLAAQTGATLAELMGRLGHSTPQAALRYQHAARGRDAEIAAALSRMAEQARLG